MSAESVTGLSLQRGTADQRWVALVDVNNFYVSCERAFAPRLKGRPIAVLSNNDGCVIARSEELKALGVEMGTPTWKLTHLVRRYRAVLMSSNFPLYADMSRRVNDVLSRFSDDVDPYSIDESFVHLPGFFTSTLRELGQEIEQAIMRETHLPVGVGIAATPTLAKLANREAKKRVDGQRVVLLESDSEVTCQLLKKTPVKAIWGVGARLAERLEQMGIINAWQLREAPDALIKKKFSITLLKTKLELQGIYCRRKEQQAQPRQQLRVSRSFGKASGDFIDLTEAVRAHVNRAGERLRAQKSQARVISVFLRTNPFDQDQPQHSDAMVWVFDQPTADTSELLHAAQKLLRRIWRAGHRYHKAGVQLMDLTSQGAEQLSLLDSTDKTARRLRSERLMQVMDEINQQQGRNTLVMGASRAKASWHMKQEHRSPAYTTSWKDLPRVVAR